MAKSPGKTGAPAASAALLEQAVKLHQAGRLSDAERAYDLVLARDPRQADALNLKGVIALAQGRISEAVRFSAQAVAAAPTYAPAHFNRGNALAAAGDQEQALAAFRKAIALAPVSPDAYLGAGVLLANTGRRSEAIAMFEALTKACPTDARGHRNLALTLAEALPAADETAREKIGEAAAAAFEKVAALAPNDAAILFDYGNLMMARTMCANAIPLYERAIALKPDWTEAVSNLGEALRQDKQCDRAIETQRAALALRAGDTNIRIRLANALLDGRNFAEAEAIYRTLLDENPDALIPRINLGNLYREQGHYNDAMAAFEEALLRAPEGAHEAYGNMGAVMAERGWFAAAHLLNQKAMAARNAAPKIHLNHGIVALTLAHFAEGWREYEYRFEVSGDDRVDKRPSPPPYWRGEDLSGKSILLWTEQGLGDEIIYSSMIPDVVARARACVIACSERMVPIFARSFPDCAVVGFIGRAISLSGGAEFDFQSSVTSLGGFLRPDFKSFPQQQSFLKGDPAKIAERRAHYENLAQGRRIVGLSWRSSARQGAKNASLIDLAPLLTAPDVFFVNLQYGDCRAEISTVREKLGVEIYQDASVDPLQDMDAFFAQVAAMDLVITTSNTTAHVAGAQGIPVWIMLPAGKGMLWYWFLRHRRSVWYPSARLFRPSDDATGEWWQSVAGQIRGELDQK